MPCEIYTRTLYKSHNWNTYKTDELQTLDDAILKLQKGMNNKSLLKKKDNQSEEKVRDIANERTTLLKFTLHDDALVSWEEDNLTLGMSNKQTSGGIGIIKYLNLLINIVLLIAVFGG